MSVSTYFYDDSYTVNATHVAVLSTASIVGLVGMLPGGVGAFLWARALGFAWGFVPTLAFLVYVLYFQSEILEEVQYAMEMVPSVPSNVVAVLLRPRVVMPLYLGFVASPTLLQYVSVWKLFGVGGLFLTASLFFQSNE